MGYKPGVFHQGVKSPGGGWGWGADLKSNKNWSLGGRMRGVRRKEQNRDKFVFLSSQVQNLCLSNTKSFDKYEKQGKTQANYPSNIEKGHLGKQTNKKSRIGTLFFKLAFRL